MCTIWYWEESQYTGTALMKVSEDIGRRELDKNIATILVCLDFSKAFDQRMLVT